MKLTRLAQAIALLGVGAAAFAQSTPTTPAPTKLERVEITGSSIKRIQNEGALPVQTISSDDIKKAGVVNAEQLMEFISANTAGAFNLASQQGFATSFKRNNNGASSANLRGLGPENTLVLLNGRRLSTHGLNGSSVDLNSIPFAAIDRVEVLKDGASAIYGTDAIGGVINFILKKNYQGVEVSGFADVPQQSGGAIYSGSILAGTGSLEQDGFNVLASLSFDKNKTLRSGQRDFASNGFQPERGLSPDTTGTPYANVRTGGGSALSTFTYNGVDVNKVNLLSLQGKCNSIKGMSQYQSDLWGDPSTSASCAYDYGSDQILQQPVERTQLVTRGTLKINNDHQVFAEIVASRTRSEMEFVASQFTGGSSSLYYPVGGPFYPFELANAVNAIEPGAFDTTKDVRLRWRCLECGPRSQETTTDIYRALVGAEGVVYGGWDYKVGLSTARSKAETNLTNGYVFNEAFVDAFNDPAGLINPFLQPGQSQTSEAMALIESTKARTSIFGGRSTLVQLDGAISGELTQLPAGALAAALGFDTRREGYRFRPDDANYPQIKDEGGSPALNEVTRNIFGIYGELSIPILKNLEAQVALRYDHYSGVGNTTNPKVALRYQPVQELVVRASAGTGFRAPDFTQLYGGEIETSLNNSVLDPDCPVPVPAADPDCTDKWTTRTKGNPNLKPEKSTQWNLGFVVQPVEWFSGSIDFWNIDRTDVIVALDARSVLQYPGVFGTNTIVRDGDGFIDYIQADYVNAAGNKARGLDLNLTFNGRVADGKWVAALDGTYMQSYKTRLADVQPYTELVGEFGNIDTSYANVFPRWKHAARVTYSTGPWSGTFFQTFTSGYKAQLPLGVVPAGFDPDVGAYTLYHASVTYTGLENATFTAGIRNLFDTDPPFSGHNVDDVSGTGWDARVADPRGRSFQLRATYKFF